MYLMEIYLSGSVCVYNVKASYILKRYRVCFIFCGVFDLELLHPELGAVGIVT